MTSEFAPGDWVSGYQKGFFRVERVIRRFYDESHEGGVLETHKIGDEFDDPMLVLKRAFDSKFQRSLGWNSCSSAHCKHLPQLTVRRISDTLQRDVAFRKALDEYVVPPIKSVLNIGLNLSATTDGEKVQWLVPFVQEGRTFREIVSKMDELGISDLRRYSYNATLQFENGDYETREKRLIFRDARLLLYKA